MNPARRIALTRNCINGRAVLAILNIAPDITDRAFDLDQHLPERTVVGFGLDQFAGRLQRMIFGPSLFLPRLAQFG